ncbi:MAG TPA: nitrilase-related carbon-nitrogen hydrolase [Thermomicrobiales bacterium]|nr:nitrilase-related carbon-nitrogen hydrolase [Thermomicrobiales bacterium]
MRIALVQMRCEKGDIAGNLSRIEAETAAAGERGVGIVVFPEMSITGYIEPAQRPEAVLDLDSEPVREFILMTDGRRVTALAGIVERNPEGKPFITQIVASDGRLAGVYRKITIVDEEADWFSPGQDVPIFEHRGVPFGISICADIDNPAVFAASVARGARFVLECAAPGLYGEQETRTWQTGYDWWREKCADQLGGYAREHRIYVAAATQAGRTVDEDFPGGGYLFGPDGATLAATADWSEGVLDVEIPVGE